MSLYPRRNAQDAGESWRKFGEPRFVFDSRYPVAWWAEGSRVTRFYLVCLAMGAALALLFTMVAPAAARANTSITGPDGAHFGETVGVTFDAGRSKVDPFNWWARVDCDAGYAEYLHLGDQAGYPVNDDRMTFGPTPSWTAGGSSCVVTLLAYDGNGRFVPYASDDFEVLP